MKIVTLFLALFLFSPIAYANKNKNSYHWKELECLAKNLYYEARGEGHKGMLAVGTVTMNRVHHSLFPNSVCDVVYEKTKNNVGKTVCQFSWVCQSYIKKKHKNLDLYKQAVAIATGILYGGNRLHKLERALFFHADYVNPKWRNVRQVATIGRHIFYEPRS